MHRRIVIIELLFVFVSTIIVGRSIYIQFSAPPQLASLANRQFKSKVTALPSRGVIYDREGNELAISLKVRSLYVRPQALKTVVTSHSALKRISRALAHTLSMNPEKVYEKLNSKKSFLWLKRQLTDKEEELIRDTGLDGYNDGIGLAEESKRIYPNRQLAAHALGTVNIDGQGIEGLELYYDAILAGEQTRIQSLKDAKGRSIFLDDKGILAFKHGKSITLTLDKTVQYETEKTLKNVVDTYRANSASAIVADVSTGEILGMANYPTYDPNSPKNYSLESRRNRIITDIEEPGSTMKPVLMGLALSKGLSPQTQIYCERGQFKVADRTISEAETHEKFEWLTLTEIIKLSSNIGAAKLALQLGPEPLAKWLQTIGMGTKQGIDLPGESNGLSQSAQSFYDSLKSQVRLANVGFGHGITFTPLQLFSIYLAIANKGQWIEPHLVKTVLEENGSVAHEFKNLTRKQLMDPKVAGQILNMLATVTLDGGTGTKASLDEWSVGGKTGTAQKIDPKTKKYSRNKYLASFIGVAPAKNPRIVALVMVDEPQTKYYAGETAAPAFREIAKAALLRLNVQPDLETYAEKLAEHQNKNAVHAMAASVHNEEKSSANEIIRNEENPDQFRLPNMKGYSIREAMKTISDQGIEVEILGSGILKQQVPASEQWVKRGTKVKLVFE